MSWKTKEPKKQELEDFFKPTPAQYDALRAEMKKYKYELCFGRKWGAFEQAMHHMGIVRLENGQLFVRDPQKYTMYLNMNSKIQAKDDAELKEILDTMPEEKEAYQKRLAPIFADIRSFLSRTRSNVKV